MFWWHVRNRCTLVIVDSGVDKQCSTYLIISALYPLSLEAHYNGKWSSAVGRRFLLNDIVKNPSDLFRLFLMYVYFNTESNLVTSFEHNAEGMLCVWPFKLGNTFQSHMFKHFVRWKQMVEFTDFFINSSKTPLTTPVHVYHKTRNLISTGSCCASIWRRKNKKWVMTFKSILLYWYVHDISTLKVPYRTSTVLKTANICLRWRETILFKLLSKFQWLFCLKSET